MCQDSAEIHPKVDKLYLVANKHPEELKEVGSVTRKMFLKPEKGTWESIMYPTPIYSDHLV